MGNKNAMFCKYLHRFIVSSPGIGVIFTDGLKLVSASVKEEIIDKTVALLDQEGV